jgi:hypothetical protein
MKLRVKFIGKLGAKTLIVSDIDLTISDTTHNPFCYAEDSVNSMLSQITFEITSIKEVD